MRSCIIRLIPALAALLAAGLATAQDRPNILVIWGDGVGQDAISAYGQGIAGYRTPNIDRIAIEGMLFTDAYGGRTSTAGRAAYMTGQSVYRTGLSGVGAGGSWPGLRRDDPTIAALLGEHGYMTGHFGKHHVGHAREASTSRAPVERGRRRPIGACRSTRITPASGSLPPRSAPPDMTPTEERIMEGYRRCVSS